MSKLFKVGMSLVCSLLVLLFVCIGRCAGLRRWEGHVKLFMMKVIVICLFLLMLLFACNEWSASPKLHCISLMWMVRYRGPCMDDIDNSVLHLPLWEWASFLFSTGSPSTKPKRRSETWKRIMSSWGDYFLTWTELVLMLMFVLQGEQWKTPEFCFWRGTRTKIHGGKRT